VLAADVGAGQPEIHPDDVNQRATNLDDYLDREIVHGDTELERST